MSDNSLSPRFVRITILAYIGSRLLCPRPEMSLDDLGQYKEEEGAFDIGVQNLINWFTNADREVWEGELAISRRPIRLALTNGSWSPTRYVVLDGATYFTDQEIEHAARLWLGFGDGDELEASPTQHRIDRCPVGRFKCKITWERSKPW